MAEEIDPGTFADNIQRLLYRLVREHEHCDRVCLARLGVSAAQGYTILALPETGALRMNELSEAMGLANSTMTRMADHLVSKGFVQRGPDEEDRRVIRIWLTARGREIRRDLDAMRLHILEEASGQIPASERAGILSALVRLTAIVEKAAKCCSREG